MLLTKSQRDYIILEMRDISEEFQFDTAITTSIIHALNAELPLNLDQLHYLETHFEDYLDADNDGPCIEISILALIRLELTKITA